MKPSEKTESYEWVQDYYRPITGKKAYNTGTCIMRRALMPKRYDTNE